MRIWHAIILGIIQGITELLPISSSGHLKISETLLGLPNVDELLFFDVLLHLGTLLAVLVAYRRDISRLFSALLHLFHPSRRRGQTDAMSRRMIFLLLLATLPLALVVVLKDVVAAVGTSLFFIGAMLLLNGLILFLSERFAQGEKREGQMTLVDAILIGLAQVCATVPGISRSGATISMGLGRGLAREYAVKFSFLMSIPAVLGAAILELADAVKQKAIVLSDLPAYLIGVLVSAVVGYFAIRLLEYIARRDLFGKFCYYCWGAGIVTLLIALLYI